VVFDRSGGCWLEEQQQPPETGWEIVIRDSPNVRRDSRNAQHNLAPQPPLDL
jgi:hypothetical protein